MMSATNARKIALCVALAGAAAAWQPSKGYHDEDGGHHGDWEHHRRCDSFVWQQSPRVQDSDLEGNTSVLMSKCLWFNSTDNKTHGYMRACTRVAVDYFWWIPAVIVGFFLACCIAPCFFVARFVCNCCGGHMPGFGLCISSAVSVAGVTFRSYSKLSKIVTLVLLLVFAFVSFGSGMAAVHRNHRARDAMRNAWESVGPAPPAVRVLKSAVEALGTMAPVDATAKAALETVSPIATKAGRWWDDVENSDFANDVSNAFFALRLFVLCIALTTVLVAITLAVSCLGAGQNVTVAAICGSMMLVLIGLVPDAAVSSITTIACDAWNSTTMPVAEGIARRHGYCSNATVDEAVSNVTKAVAPLSVDPSSDYCMALGRMCQATSASSQFHCAAFVDSACATGIVGSTTVQLTAAVAQFNSVAPTAALRACAKSAADCPAGTHADAQTVVKFADTQLLPAAKLMGVTPGSVSVVNATSCATLRRWADENVNWRLCGDAREQSRKVASQMSGFVWTLLLLILPVILTIKRLRCKDRCGGFGEYPRGGDMEAAVTGAQPAATALFAYPGATVNILGQKGAEGVMVTDGAPVSNEPLTPAAGVIFGGPSPYQTSTGGAVPPVLPGQTVEVDPFYPTKPAV